MDQAQFDAQERIQSRWHRFLKESHIECDEVTVAAALGVLVADWLAGLPEEVAESWIENLGKFLEEMRGKVS